MKNIYLIFCFLIAYTSYYLNGQIINIPADYPTIQQGIDASQDGDTVLVQPGTYVEQIIYNGKNITLGSLFLLNGNENYIEQTIIDGDGFGLPCVRFIHEETTNAKLIGFTIQNGFVGTNFYGAGVHVFDASPYLDHLIIKDNNSQSGQGGGISWTNRNAIIKNSKFYNNICNNGGGAIYITGTQADIINCEFYNNSAYGGGSGGAGIFILAANANISNCEFYNNFGNCGAAIFAHTGSYCKIINSIIYHNSGNDALRIGTVDSLYIINSIIANNYTPIGILISSTTAPRMINSIVSGHSQYNIQISGGGPFYIDYSIIQGGESTISVVYPQQIEYWEHNYDGDPIFVDTINGNFRLSDCSSGIGAGIDSLVMAEQLVTAPDYDFLNSPRPQPEGSNPDIGAYENDLGIPFIPPTITSNPVGTSKCEGGSHTMSVQATGSPEITFQWQKNDVDIPGETNDTFQLINLTTDDEANYRCLVTNSCETKYSNQAFVEVKEAPGITQQPQDEQVYFGDNATFTVAGDGDEPLSYQWFGPSGLLENDTLSVLQINNVSASDVGDYYCTITNMCASVTSSYATLNAYEQLSVNAGQDIGIFPGDSTILNGSYSGGSPSVSIHWTPESFLYNPDILNPQTVALHSSQAFTLTVNDLLVGYQASDEVFVTVIEDDTTGYFGDENDTLYQYSSGGNCGYISGNNCDQDKIKANYFTDALKTYNIEKVLLRFGIAVKTSVDEVPVKIGIWSKSGTGDTPSDLLDYQEVNLSQIVQDVMAGNLTCVTYQPPVSAPKDFFVGVFLPTGVGDTVALMTNKDGESEAGIAWTLNAANEWLSYSSDPRFFLRVSNAIFPVVKQNNVGINDFQLVTENVLIYPNPANDVLNIQFDKKEVEAELVIYDIQGKTMISKRIQQAKTTINIGNLNPGVYIIQVEYDQDFVTRRLIVY